jgi:hypothetical protein
MWLVFKNAMEKVQLWNFFTYYKLSPRLQGIIRHDHIFPIISLIRQFWFFRHVDKHVILRRDNRCTHWDALIEIHWRAIISVVQTCSPMKVLCVAEKPSIAKSITQILSGGQFTTVRRIRRDAFWWPDASIIQHNTQTNFIKNYEFDYPQTQSFFVVTAVAGHLTSYDFDEAHRKWTSCEPFSLFDAHVEVQVASDKKSIEQNLLTRARTSDMLMIWTDCDREGEHIGMEIARVCRKAKSNIHIKRARFSAIIAQ